MKVNKVLVIFLICFSINSAFAQKSNVWLTYEQSKFMYSPGIEASYFFNRYIGLQLGVNVYFQVYDKDKIANVSDDYFFNFYNANLNFCSYLLYKPKHKVGITAGFKVYYGPEYEILHYYSKGGYYIYYDSSQLRPSYGVDLGIIYLFKRFATVIKFDTARKKFRIGIGYSFGKFSK